MVSLPNHDRFFDEARTPSSGDASEGWYPSPETGKANLKPRLSLKKNNLYPALCEAFGRWIPAFAGIAGLWADILVTGSGLIEK